jgi:hypothetical protein
MDSANYDNPKYVTDSTSKRNIPNTTEKYTVTALPGSRKENFWILSRAILSHPLINKYETSMQMEES